MCIKRILTILVTVACICAAGTGGAEELEYKFVSEEQSRFFKPYLDDSSDKLLVSNMRERSIVTSVFISDKPNRSWDEQSLSTGIRYEGSSIYQSADDTCYLLMAVVVKDYVQRVTRRTTPCGSPTRDEVANG